MLSCEKFLTEKDGSHTHVVKVRIEREKMGGYKMGRDWEWSFITCFLNVVLPKIWENLGRGFNSDSQILQNKIWYDEIESSRNKDTGNVFRVKQILNSEWIKSPQVEFEPTTSQLTVNRSTAEVQLQDTGGEVSISTSMTMWRVKR